MMDTTSYPGEYRQIFLQKVTVFRFLEAAERIYLLEHYINYSQAHILHLNAEVADMRANKKIEPAQLAATSNVVQHLIDQWQLELDWARGLRESESLQAASPEDTRSLAEQKQG